MVLLGTTMNMVDRHNVNDPLANEWSCPSGSVGLGEDEVHIWRASLDQDSTIVLHLSQLLAPDEYQKAQKFYRASDRDRYIVGRGVLRQILSTYLNVPPDQIRFSYNKYGKPSLADDQNHLALNFNLSHS